VLIVGYDDSVTYTHTVRMTDGGSKTFTHTGVYYFKNSWGTDWGSNFSIKGHWHAGYGMITQDYANEFGQFFTFGLTGVH
jgi:C1A family cysteine protease